MCIIDTAMETIQRCIVAVLFPSMADISNHGMMQSASLQLLDPYVYQGAFAKACNMPNASSI